MVPLPKIVLKRGQFHINTYGFRLGCHQKSYVCNDRCPNTLENLVFFLRVFFHIFFSVSIFPVIFQSQYIFLHQCIKDYLKQKSDKPIYINIDNRGMTYENPAYSHELD